MAVLLVWQLENLFTQQVSPASGACSLASVESTCAKKKRKTAEDDSDEAEDFTESDCELGEPTTCFTVYYHQCDADITLISGIVCAPTVCLSGDGKPVCSSDMADCVNEEENKAVRS